MTRAVPQSARAESSAFPWRFSYHAREGIFTVTRQRNAKVRLDAVAATLLLSRTVYPYKIIFIVAHNIPSHHVPDGLEKRLIYTIRTITTDTTTTTTTTTIIVIITLFSRVVCESIRRWRAGDRAFL